MVRNGKTSQDGNDPIQPYEASTNEELYAIRGLQGLGIDGGLVSTAK